MGFVADDDAGLLRKLSRMVNEGLILFVTEVVPAGVAIDVQGALDLLEGRGPGTRGDELGISTIQTGPF